MTQKTKDNIIAGAVLAGAVAIVVVAAWIFGGYGLIVAGTAVASMLAGN